MDTNKKSYKTIDEYIKMFPKDIQVILEKIRQTIHQAAPDATEAISYRMPTFKQGRILIHFAAFKDHIGLFPPVPEVFKKEVTQYAGPKYNLSFPYDKPIPYGLIKRIIKYRVKEILKKRKK